MYAIVAVDKNWGIGRDNQLLARIPADMKQFASKTRGNIIIIGRKTLESFKDGKPLKDRVNVVLTRSRLYKCEGTVVVHSLDELEDLLGTYPGDIYVCGGESVYRQLLPYCEKVYVTKFDRAFEADSHFPNLDQDDRWVLESEGEWQNHQDLPFKFTCYRAAKHMF